MARNDSMSFMIDELLTDISYIDMGRETIKSHTIPVGP
jgi:hypothetical protein